MAQSACLPLEPGLLEAHPACCLLGCSHMPHAERFFMSCFWSENTWTRRPWIPHCLIEQARTIKGRQCMSICCLWKGEVAFFPFILKMAASPGCCWQKWGKQVKIFITWPCVVLKIRRWQFQLAASPLAFHNEIIFSACVYAYKLWGSPRLVLDWHWFLLVLIHCCSLLRCYPISVVVSKRMWMILFLQTNGRVSKCAWTLTV